MRILITGMAGFIGFHLSNRLINKDNVEIIGMDNLNDYYDVNLKKDRLKELGIASISSYGEYSTSNKYQDLKFVFGSLEDKDLVNKIFNDTKFDIVINLAAQAGVRYSIDHPDIYIKSNIEGFYNILENCRNHISNVKHLVFASSSSVYGLNTKMPFSTKDTTDHPISLYAATKKSNELMAHVYSHLYGINVTGLRFFTVYGPWGRPDMAYFKFSKLITDGQEIEVYNNGDMKRDFTYIDDITAAIEKIIEKTPQKKELKDIDSSSSTAAYKIYNIGRSNPVQLMDIIENIEKNLGIEAKKKFMPIQPGDVLETFCDSSELEKDFNIKPKVDVAEGLKKFVEWYKSYYK